ncbi:HAUS augmin-like complex subunit 5 isoform X2 [Halichondria panicea]|uniref:HAUS augmin-like complex subunit 5 isoform X2 n=1 Tax=Halichondria panicea TaxID=6063 RepID=UPI00312B3668
MVTCTCSTMSKQHSKHGRRKGGVSRSEDQAQAMLKWAVDDMRLSTDTLPSLEDLNTLLRGSTGNTWDYICEHVHSSTIVNTARQNLRLHSGGVSTEHAQLLAEQNELQRELASLQVAVSQTLQDANRLEADIVAVETTNQCTRAEMDELCNKSTLLSAHSVRCEEVVHVLMEYCKRMRHREELCRYPDKEQSYFTREPSSISTTPVTLETACMRDVRSVCGVVEEVVLYGGESDGGGERLREQAWSRVEALLAAHPPHEILGALTRLTAELADKIHSHTESIDLTRDAQELRYQEQPDGEGSVLLSVEDHLMSARLDHVTNALTAEGVDEGAAQAQGHLEEVKGQLEECVASVYSGEVRDLVRTKVLLELEVAGLEGGWAVISQLVSQLQSSLVDKRQGLDTLASKKKRVGLLANNAESNQASIQGLVKHNSRLHGRLTHLATELNLYLRDSVCGVESVLVGGARDLMNSIATETRLFSTVCLTRAMKAPGISVPWCHLSIRCFHPHQPSGHASWKPLLPLLGLSPTTSPENALSELVACLRRVALLASETDQLRGVVFGMKAVKESTTQGVLESCERYDEQLRGEGLCAVRQCLSHASHGLSRCSHVEQTMKEWWEQPAQYCVPWVTCDGMSCDKWIDQWRVLTTKLRQLTSSQTMS